MNEQKYYKNAFDDNAKFFEGVKLDTSSRYC